jgi:hypothetical protein
MRIVAISRQESFAMFSSDAYGANNLAVSVAHSGLVRPGDPSGTAR